MLAPVTVRYAFRPVRRSLATAHVADLFGLPEREPPHAIAENLELDIRPGDVALFTGPSGSGKSSLLRAVAAQVNAVDAFARELPDVPLVDALPGSVEDRLAVLAGCGLSEARLLLRTPAELSEGQRYRFRLAYGLSVAGRQLPVSGGPVARGRLPVEVGAGTLTDDSAYALSVDSLQDSVASQRATGRWLLADEFTATLDRTLAKVVAFNLRKLAARTGVGVLAATTHEDVVEDLQPDVWVRCDDGHVIAERRGWKRRPVSFAGELWLSDGSRSDWPHFARWHYRSHRLAFVRRVIVLWHGPQAVGVCVFGSPAASLALRSRFFGLTNPRSRVALAALNEQLWLLQRVVLHPTYRGAGIAAAFVRRACELCPVDWVETLTAMGRVNPFFERAGFVRVGTITKNSRLTPAVRQTYGAYGTKRPRVSAETAAKSRFSEPVYYVFDNRGRVLRR